MTSLFANHGRGEGLTVLVVDSYVDAATSLAELLRLWGFDSTTSFKGSDALERLSREPADVVVLDLLLSDMNGCDLAQDLRGRFGVNCPLFISLTTCHQETSRQRACEAGIAFHLLKPTDLERLHSILVGHQQHVTAAFETVTARQSFPIGVSAS